MDSTKPEHNFIVELWFTTMTQPCNKYLPKKDEEMMNDKQTLN